MIEEGQTVLTEITDMSDQGQAIGRTDGLIVFVPGAVPGDRVSAVITKMNRNYALAELQSVEKPSKKRIEPFCPYSETCGGCAMASIDYQEQLPVKKKQVSDKLIHIGGVCNPDVKDMLFMKNPFHYRNKAVFAVKDRKVGFYRAGSHEIEEIRDCMLVHPAAMAAAEALREFLADSRAVISGMTVRTSETCGEAMVVLGSPYDNISQAERLIEMLDERMTGEDMSLESVALDNKGKVSILAGKKTVRNRTGGIDLEISPLSFYQVNPEMTEKLYDKAAEYAGFTGKEILLDLYCGAGSIGLSCAGKARYVIGIESLRDAVLDANRNASINGIVNARYICGKAETELPALLAGEGDEELAGMAEMTDVVILDPPRAGCRRELLEAAAAADPKRIVYVSCDPATLARDVKILGSLGYDFREVTPVDMFPWTMHVETVVLMSRKDK